MRYKPRSYLIIEIKDTALMANWWDHFESFKQEAFRLETLPAYNIPSEQEDYKRYLAGAPLPSPDREHIEWIEVIKRATARGATFKRARIIPNPLTSYIKYEIDWGYLYNADAGEEIRLVEEAALITNSQFNFKEDYWLFDNTIAVKMNYDSTGGFLGGELLDEGLTDKYRKTRDLIWPLATSFEDYLKERRSRT